MTSPCVPDHFVAAASVTRASGVIATADADADEAGGVEGAAGVVKAPPHAPRIGTNSARIKFEWRMGPVYRERATAGSGASTCRSERTSSDRTP